MRTLRLVLLRHAEAEDPQGRKDRARSLTRRGSQEAGKLGATLAAAGLRPDVFLASDAVRAKETAALVAKELRVEFAEDARLYLGGLGDVTEVVVERCGDAGTILLVGHNPGFSVAATALSDVSLELGTAEAAELVAEAESWEEALELTGAWELVRTLKA